MSTLRLGIAPGPLVLTLSDGGDFTDSIRLRDKTTGADVNWPAGTTLALVFGTGQSWPATISGASASWSVDKVTVAGIRDKTPVRVIYTNGTSDRPLWSGVVNFRD